MSQIGDIVEGHMNELLNKNKSLSEERLEICMRCPIAKQSVIGLVCDSSKWINDKDEVRLEATPGFTRGCGCRNSAKVTLPQAHCVIFKW